MLVVLGTSVFPIFQIRAMFDCHCEKMKAFSKGGNTRISLGERNIGIHFEMAPARQRSLLCSIDGNKDFAAKRRSSDGWLDAASHEEGCLMMRNNVSNREVAIDVSHASFNVIDTQVVVWTCHLCLYSLL